SSDVIFNYYCFAIASSNTYLTEYQWLYLFLDLTLIEYNNWCKW
ncbi:14519_t:CDS:1, partial [Acaulospora morrowiae]